MNIDDYEPVASRLARWLNDCGARDVTGRVITELIHRTDDVAVFKAELWEDNTLMATGHAEDYRSGRGPTSTNWLEVAETSAVGRALANAGLAGSDLKSRPSREEMQKAARGHQKPPETTQNTSAGGRRKTPTDKMLAYYRKLADELGVDVLPEAESDFDACRSELDRLNELKQSA